MCHRHSSEKTDYIWQILTQEAAYNEKGTGLRIEPCGTPQEGEERPPIIRVGSVCQTGTKLLQHCSMNANMLIQMTVVNSVEAAQSSVKTSTEFKNRNTELNYKKKTKAEQIVFVFFCNILDKNFIILVQVLIV